MIGEGGLGSNGVHGMRYFRIFLGVGLVGLFALVGYLALLSYGLLGVVYEVTLRVRPVQGFAVQTAKTSFQDFGKLGLKYDDDFVLYRGKGCQQCNNSGYRGRAGIHELLVASDTMKKLIQSKARVAEMVKVAKEEGMTTLVQDGIQKALEGLTDIKMVKAVAIK